LVFQIYVYFGDDGGWDEEAGAEGLAALELVEGAVEGTFEARLQQGEVFEGGEAIAIAAGDEGGAELRGEGLEALVVFLEDGRAELVIVGLALAEAAKAPPAVGDAVNENGLVGAGGLEIVLEGADGFLEIGGIFAFKDGVAGGDAVAEAVVANGGLALGSARNGGKLSVTPVGVDLTLVGHVWSTPYLLLSG